MKPSSIIVALSLAFFTLALFAFIAGEIDNKNYWICIQIGHINEHATIALSAPFVADGTAEEKEPVFEDATRRQVGMFQPDFDSRCENYKDKETVTVFFRAKFEMLEKDGISLIFVKYP